MSVMWVTGWCARPGVGEGVAGDGVGSVVGVAPLAGVVGERRWWEPVRFAAVGRYPEGLRVGRQ